VTEVFLGINLLALLQITFINIILSGDNAVVIAMASRSLPAHQQKKAIFWGGAAAIGLRIVLTALVAYALRIPLIQLVGGLLLVWIAIQLLKGGDEEHEVKAGGSIMEAIGTIVVADLIMSLDNMLAVGGASQGNMGLLLIGLVISMAIIMFASSYIAKLMNKYNWLVYVGAGILGYTAGEMILRDNMLHKVFTPTGPVEYGFPVLMVIVVLATGYFMSKKNAAPEAE
jgi:YjbE family integral membrane protein